MSLYLLVFHKTTGAAFHSEAPYPFDTEISIERYLPGSNRSAATETISSIALRTKREKAP
jgi:hypothetical protein